MVRHPGLEHVLVDAGLVDPGNDVLAVGVAGDDDVRLAGDQACGELRVLAGDDHHVVDADPLRYRLGDGVVEAFVAVALLEQHRRRPRLRGHAEHPGVDHLLQGVVLGVRRSGEGKKKKQKLQ